MFAIIPFMLSNWRALVLASAVMALIGSGLYYRHELILQGERDALQKVEDANARESSAAAAASQNVYDCANAGGVWDRDAGKCVPNHPAGQ